MNQPKMPVFGNDGQAFEGGIDPCNLPGMEGCAWRLVKHWSPDGIAAWLAGERLRNTSPQMCADAMGDVLASAVMSFGENCDDAKEAIMRGVLPAFERHLQRRVNQRTGQAPRPHIIRPGS